MLRGKTTPRIFLTASAVAAALVFVACDDAARDRPGAAPSADPSVSGGTGTTGTATRGTSAGAGGTAGNARDNVGGTSGGPASTGGNAGAGAQTGVGP